MLTPLIERIKVNSVNYIIHKVNAVNKKIAKVNAVNWAGPCQNRTLYKGIGFLQISSYLQNDFQELMVFLNSVSVSLVSGKSVTELIAELNSRNPGKP